MKINIPKTCTENYDLMSPTDLGRMCSICNKQVVDFNNMETNDIVTYIKTSNKNVCGKINKNHPIFYRPSSYKHWFRRIASLITIGSVSMIPYLQAKTITTSNVHYSNTIRSNRDTTTVTFVNDKNVPLTYVNLINKSTQEKFVTDNLGKITLPITSKSIFQVNYFGYLQTEFSLKPNMIGKTIKIVLHEDESDLIGEVVIINSKRTLKMKLSKLLNILSVQDDN